MTHAAPADVHDSNRDTYIVARDAVRFEVRGLPVAQGSLRAFRTRGGYPVITSTAKGLAAWRRLVADVAQRHAPPEPWDGPLAVELSFRLPKPKSAAKRKRWPDKRPDLDKLARAALDAITHVVIRDDSHVVRLLAGKDYGPPGVVVTVVRLCPWCGLPREHTPTRDCTGLEGRR